MPLITTGFEATDFNFECNFQNILTHITIKALVAWQPLKSIKCYGDCMMAALMFFIVCFPVHFRCHEHMGNDDNGGTNE